MFKCLIKLCVVTIITLTGLILIKQSVKLKKLVYKYVYSENISFVYINKLYKKYLGNNVLFDKKLIDTPVFNEQLVYNSKEKYMEGLKLSVTEDYLVPSLDAGLVIFVGKKEDYGNVVIVEQIDGVDVWYGNLDNINVKLYDYIDKGALIGNCDNSLYLIHKKDGNAIDNEDKV